MNLYVLHILKIVQHFLASRILLDTHQQATSPKCYLSHSSRPCLIHDQKADPALIKSPALPKSNSSPLKIGRAPKGKDRLPTIHFSGAETVSLGECITVWPSSCPTDGCV